jgi:hypothetical protein
MKKLYLIVSSILCLQNLLQASGAAAQAGGRLAARYASTVAESANVHYLANQIRLGIEILENQLASNMAKLRKLGSDFSSQAVIEREELTNVNKVLRRELQTEQQELAKLQKEALTKHENLEKINQKALEQIKSVKSSITKEELKNAHNKIQANIEQEKFVIDQHKTQEVQNYIQAQRAAHKAKEAYTGNIKPSTLGAITAAIAGFFGYHNAPEEINKKISNVLTPIKDVYDRNTTIALFESLSPEEQTKALKQAIVDNNTKIAQMLLEIGVDPNEGIALATARNNKEIVQLLLDHGAYGLSYENNEEYRNLIRHKKEKPRQKSWYEYFFGSTPQKPKRVYLDDEIRKNHEYDLEIQTRKKINNQERLRTRKEFIDNENELERNYELSLEPQAPQFSISAAFKEAFPDTRTDEQREQDSVDLERNYESSLEPQAPEFSISAAFQEAFPDTRTDEEVLQDLAQIEDAIDFNFDMYY